MRVEGVCDFEVVGYEVAEGFAADVCAGNEEAGDAHVGAAVGYEGLESAFAGPV